MYIVQVSCDATQWEGLIADDGISSNVVGALDGKHIFIQKLSNSGSMFYTYKHTFAIQLLALLDADYNFIYVPVGCQGRIGDAGVFHHSSLSKALAQDTLGIPDRTLLPNSSTQCSYTLLADEAFPLTTHLMKPCARRGLTVRERIFNYRLYRARCVVKNAFGILAHRFRIFLQPVVLHPSTLLRISVYIRIFSRKVGRRSSVIMFPSIYGNMCNILYVLTERFPLVNEIS